ncbi:VanZ family protein [Lacticaseibacillus hulanensis]|uniref:VanZ family protein n=1 Tax=Lacticaseibacillus hulanensis TaxID=2493111 RepID=UPI000FD8E4DB|nr:VanZ family protein [Lacticaseibacillus hulanensis]
MNAYLIPIRTAVITFPILALIIALPFLIVQYRRYGSFTFSRAFVLYSFIFYMLTAYFMVILPLPARDAVAKLTTARMQLLPFTAISDFFGKSGFVVTAPGTWVRALKSSYFLQPAFNTLLTVPFGFYLRYYFRRSWKQTLGLAFCLSLFYELTQLSGLYFIYPRPYRLFDVDDLIVNSLGGMIGFWLTPLLRLAFPNREKMDEVSYAKGEKVGWIRRLVALFVDASVLLPAVRFLFHTGFALAHAQSLADNNALTYTLAVLVVFIGIPHAMHGRTVGKAIVRIKIVPVDPEERNWRRRLSIREALLYLVALPIWQSFGKEAQLLLTHIEARTQLNFIALGILTVGVLFFTADIIWTLICRDGRLFYDDWAKTKQISTVKRTTVTSQNSKQE